MTNTEIDALLDEWKYERLMREYTPALDVLLGEMNQGKPQ